MRTRVWKLIAYLVFIAILIGSATTAIAQQAPVRGKVMDQEGAPLSGVQIEVTTTAAPDAIKARTKKKGTFTIILPQSSWEYEFRFTLDGYQELTIPIQATNDSIEITLARTQKAAPAAPNTPRPVVAPREPGQHMTQQKRAAILLFNEGVTALEAGDTDGATASFRRATVTDPSFPEPYRALMATAAEAEDWTAAANAARSLLRLEPDDLDAKWTLYDALLRVGDAETVASAASNLGKADPQSAAEMVSNAQSLFDIDEFAVTRALLEVAIEVDPDQVDAYFVLGMSCNALGDTEAAKSALTKFLEVASKDHVDIESARSMLEYLG